MSNRNATASWSGYSHQGQVGILVALRQIQQVGVDLDTYFVQFETHEDVAIYEQLANGDKRYLSAHQVKAYYSAGNHLKNTYSDVLNGNFENGETRFLHTTVQISNWNDAGVPNANNVSLYTYAQNPLQQYCSTTDIETYIKAELTTILVGSTPPIVENAYYRLCFELDNKIRTEHQKASKNLFDIRFGFREIDELIRSQEQFQKKELLESRRLFYATFIEIISDDAFTQDRIDLVQDSIIRDINSMTDDQFLLFLQLLNLNETAENLQSAQVNFNKDGLEQVFFKLILTVVNCVPLLEKSSVNYTKPTNTGKFVLTSIIAEQNKARRVVENILANLKSQNLLWENHILVNKEIDADLVNNNPSIGRITTVYSEETDGDKFMSFSKSKLMNRNDAFNLLNHE